MFLTELTPGHTSATKLNFNTPQLKKIQDELAQLDIARRNLKDQYYRLGGSSSAEHTRLDAKIRELNKLIADLTLKRGNILASIRDKQTTTKGFSKLEADCGEALTIFREAKQVLYRGSSSARLQFPDGQFHGHPRKDRLAKDSYQIMQAAYDALLKKLGYSALRSNGLFCTANPDQALGYGQVYVIFPKNGFTYTWSTVSEDIVFDDADLMYLSKKPFQKYIAEVNRILKAAKIEILRWDDFDDIVDAFDQIHTKIDQAMEEDSITFAQVQYLEKLRAIPVDGFINSKMLYSHFKPTNTNLARAMAEEHEVCIKGDYYALEYSKYADTLSSWLGFEI